MKRFTILWAMLLLIASKALAQTPTQTNTQFPNPGFEKWIKHSGAGTTGTGSNAEWVPYNWHTFDECTGTYSSYGNKNHHYSQNYNNSSMTQYLGTPTNSSKYIGITCKYINYIIVTAYANGALSTGRTMVGSSTPTNNGNYNYTDPSTSSSYSTSGKFSWSFVGCPDSMSFYYYTKMNKSTVRPLFKVFLHGSGEFRDRADGSLQGGSAAKLIGSSVDTFAQSSSWKRETWPFTYTKPGQGGTEYTFLGQNASLTEYGYYSTLNRPTYMLASFSTDKKAGNSAQSEGDALYIDELWCIYDKGLASLAVNGAADAAMLSFFNSKEWLTHEPSRSYDANGNPIFNNSGTATYEYTAQVSCGNIPQISAMPKSKLITEFTITQASAENNYTATIHVKHNDNSTFDYNVKFTNIILPTITLNNGGVYSACVGEEITVTASGAVSYSWSNGATGETIHPTESGNYTVSGTDANGCVGTNTAYVTVNPLPVITINGSLSICSGEATTITAGGGSEYLWSNGATVNSVNISTAGNYSVTVTTSHGCSATKEITISENEAPTVSISGVDMICSGAEATLSATTGSGYSYLWNDNSTEATKVITAGGTYSVTVTDANGCKGSATKTVQNKQTPSVSISGNDKICNGASVVLTANSDIPGATFTWNDGTTGSSITASASGTYTVIGNVDGCESSASKEVATAEAPAAPAITSAERCGAGSMTLTAEVGDGETCNWYANATTQEYFATGSSYTTPEISSTATYFVSAQNAAGCLSERVAVTATINPIPSAPTVSNASYCGGGTYTLAATSDNQILWYAGANDDEEISAEQTINETKTFYAAAKSDNGCVSQRSALTVTINAIPAVPSVATPDPVCSNVAVNVTLSATSGNGGETVKWYNSALSNIAQGNTYQAKNINANTTFYASSFNSSTNCESEKVGVEIVKNSLPDVPVLTCEPRCGAGEVTLNGNAGTLQVKWYDASGNFLANGNSYSANIQETTTFKATAYNDETGCESAQASVAAVVNNILNTEFTQSACEEFVWNAETFTQSGDFTRTFTSKSGCDSVVTMHLTINHGYQIERDTTVCDQLNLQGDIYTQSGQISKTFKSVTNCDSVVTYNLTVLKSTTSAQTLTLCSNQLPYDYAGTTITSAGTKTITIENASGCDSVITLSVTVNQKPAAATLSSSDFARCDVGAVTLTASTGSNGTICRWYSDGAGENLLATANSFTTPSLAESTTYYVSSYNANTQCESSVIPVVAAINPIPEVPQVAGVERCGAGEITINATAGENATTCRWFANNAQTSVALATGTTFTRNIAANSTFYVESYNAETGCKSSRIPVTATVNSIPATPIVSNAENCGALTADFSEYVATNANAYRWYSENGELLSENKNFTTTISNSGTLSVTIYNAETQCESQKANIAITINPNYEPQNLYDTICQYVTYNKNGINQTFDASGDYTFTIQELSSHQCDSVVILNLHVKPQKTFEFTEAACDNYVWGSTTYTQSGDYTQTFTAANGCDSVVTLHLTIYESYNTSFEKSACNKYVWNGVTYTQSGTYVNYFAASNGCDSTVTMYLTIYPTYNIHIYETACEEYQWNDKTYSQSGTYVQYFASVNNCDSTVNLHLTINHSSEVTLSDEVCQGVEYHGFGFDTTFNAAGIYNLVHYGKNVHGCDSTTYLQLTVNPVYETNISKMICENSSYSFNGENLSNAGVYVANLSSVSGCDSIVTLTLTIGAEYRDTITAHICAGESYNENGFAVQQPTENGFYTQELIAANGCDSVAVLHLIVHELNTTTINAERCQGDKYQEFGFDVETAEAGEFTYNQTVTTEYGCDSTVVLNLTVHPSYLLTDQITTCNSETPYFYEPANCNVDVRTPGTRDTLITNSTTFGCDSNLVLTVNVLQTYETNIEKTFCSNSEELPYQLGDLSINESGDYTYTFTAANGCDSVVNLSMTINETKATSIDATICLGESYTENGFDITPTEAGTQVISKTETCVQTGCDSVVTLTLTANPVHDLHLYDTICVGSQYADYGFDITPDSEGDVVIAHQSTNIFGCDSTFTLHLTAFSASEVSHELTLCNGEAISQFGFDTLITEVGTHVLTHYGKNIHGCDSTTTLTVTIFPVYSTDAVVDICDNELPYLWENDDFLSYQEAGNYDINFVTQNGCDSIIHLTLNVHPTYVKDTAVAICEGALPYYFDAEHVYNESGNYEISLQTENGCDSIWHLSLTVIPTVEHNVAHEICDSELPYTFMDQTFTEAGDYDITTSDDDNCITITHFALTVNSTYQHFDEITVCEENLPFIYGDSTLLQSGTYDIHFSSVAHCDSVITLTLNVIPTARQNEEMHVCTSNFPVFFGDSTFNNAGTYDVVFHRNGLCDSIVTLSIIEAEEYLFVENETACDHELPYIWRGKSLTQSGIYNDSLQSVFGCDSVYRLNLIINETQLITENNIVLCMGESEIWRGKTLSEQGTYRDTINNGANGCREIYQVEVIVNPTYLFHDSITVCSDDLPYVWHDMNVTEAGVKEIILQTSETFCDSIYRLTLTINNSYHATESASVCDYDLPYVWHNKSLTESGTYYDTLQTVSGCDSTFTLALTVNPSQFITESDEVCQSALPYVWRGRQLTETGIFHDTIPNIYGCDDIYEINLTVYPTSTTMLYDTICAGSTYNLYGFDTLAANAGVLYAKQNLTNYNGCDSIVNLILQVMPNYLIETNASTCENVPYEWRGNEYVVEGTYYDNLTSMYGCDSIFVLNLTINPTYDIFVSDSALRNHEYVYDNFVITPADSGHFEYDIQYYSLAGCDSIVHLSLYVAYNYGIADIDMPNFSFFPNPTTAFVNIKGEQMKKVEVYSATGVLISRHDVEDPDFARIDVSNYPTGNYIVKVTLFDERSVSGKIIIQRR